MVVSGAIAAAFALPGCAPAGYNAADYGTAGAPAAQPAANAAQATAAPTSGAEPTDQPTDQPTDKPTDKPATGDNSDKQQNVPQLTDKELTNELHGTTVKRMGEVIEDEAGWVLYRSDKDKSNPSKSTCTGACAKVFLPALTDGNPELDGVNADLVGTVKRADGTKQITIKGWPVYRYIGDKVPGTWKGQNVGGTWFVIKPDGTKNLTCLPKISKPVAPPAGDSGNQKSGGKSDNTSSGGGSGSDYSY